MNMQCTVIRIIIICFWIIARMLINIGDINRARPLLEKYLAYDSSNLDLDILLAKIYYWQADYKVSNSILQKLLLHFKDNKAIELKDKADLAESPWVSLETTSRNDNQPLQTITPSVEAGIYLDKYSSLNFSFQTQVFIIHTHKYGKYCC